MENLLQTGALNSIYDPTLIQRTEKICSHLGLFTTHINMRGKLLQGSFESFDLWLRISLIELNIIKTCCNYMHI